MTGADLIAAPALVDGLWVGVEVVGALVVGALLAAWLQLRAPYGGHGGGRVGASGTSLQGATGDDGFDARTQPGATTRVAAPVGRSSPVAPARSDAPVGLVHRFRDALGRTRAALQDRLGDLLGRPVDAAMLEELEEALLVSDVGVRTAGVLVERVKTDARAGVPPRDALRAAMAALLTEVHRPLTLRDGLNVILVVGVNGSGKTTTIGKLGARYRRAGKRVLLAAGDTFRAAAADQLEAWSQRADVDLVRLGEDADPGAVVFQASERAVQQGYDVLIIDTAGRLQTRKPLMAELEKLQRVIRKHVPDAPHETLLVLDGTMGQNGLSQAALFHEATPLTGVVVTKLDGTAKGGMVLTIASELGLPVKLVGIGESIDDLKDFDPVAFADALA